MNAKNLRYWFKHLAASMLLTIPHGPLAGHKWSVASGTRFFRNTYDPEQVPQFVGYAPPGAVVYDIGAHIGFYSIIAAHAVGAAGRVYAFEPLPLNIGMLERHLRANRVDNVEVLKIGVADRAGTARFCLGKGTGRGFLGDEGEIEVSITTLDALVDSGRLPPPQLIKMDIEGAELGALQGGARMIAQHKPTLFLSVHGAEVEAGCRQFLNEQGYTLRNVKESTILAVHSSRLASA